MFAAFIPIRPAAPSDDIERNDSSAQLDKQHSQDDAVFTSAIWWRKVNRGMSVIGLLIIGAIIALIVIGVQQRWGH
jgi:hypothetical protein